MSGGPSLIGARSPFADGLPNGLRAFRHRNFRLFWTGQLISLVGTWMQQVAQSWLVLELTNDALILGLVVAAQFLPVLVLGLFGGLAADAIPKRTGLLLTQVASAVLALVLGLLAATGSVEVWQVVVLAFGLGVVNAFDMPIRQSFVIEMVGRADVANAVGYNSAIFNGSRILGPAVAGLIIAAVGIAPCFLINAATYLAVIASLLMMRSDELFLRPPPSYGHSVGAIVDQLVEGLRYVRVTPVILLAVTVVGIVSTAALNFQVLLPLVARDLLDGNAEMFGFLAAASGVGSLVSALSLAVGRGPTVRRLITGAAVIGAATLLVAASRWLPLSLVAMAITGWGLIAMAATTNTIIQLVVPDDLRGRVMSVYTTIFAGSSPIGGLLAGAVAAAAGVGAALALGGVIALATAGVAAAWIARSHAVSWGPDALDGQVPAGDPVAPGAPAVGRPR